MNKFLPCLAVVFLIGAAAHGELPSQAEEYEVKAEFLERLTRFIEWPDNPPVTPFVISVIGRSSIEPFLERIARDQQIKGQRVRIQKIDAPAEIDRCQVLFIARSQRENLSGILERTRGKPILTVGDSDGFAAQGVLVNFYSAKGEIGFEINEPAVRRSGLRVSGRILRLAKLVK